MNNIPLMYNFGMAWKALANLPGLSSVVDLMRMQLTFTDLAKH